MLREWGPGLIDLIPRSALVSPPTSVQWFLCFLQTSPTSPRSQLLQQLREAAGGHYDHIVHPSGNGGPEKWGVLPTAAQEGLFVEGHREWSSRWKEGSLPGRAGTDTRPRGGSTSPASPSFFPCSVVLPLFTPPSRAPFISSPVSKEQCTK